MISFGWVGLYGILTTVGYLIANTIYTHFVDNILKQARAFFFFAHS